jgi:hypothetical protein
VTTATAATLVSRNGDDVSLSVYEGRLGARSAPRRECPLPPMAINPVASQRTATFRPSRCPLKADDALLRQRRIEGAVGPDSFVGEWGALDVGEARSGRGCRRAYGRVPV